MKAVETEIALTLDRAASDKIITIPSGLSADIVASLLIDAVEGMKCRRQDMEEVDETVATCSRSSSDAADPLSCHVALRVDRLTSGKL